METLKIFWLENWNGIWKSKKEPLSTSNSKEQKEELQRHRDRQLRYQEALRHSYVHSQSLGSAMFQSTSLGTVLHDVDRNFRI